MSNTENSVIDLIRRRGIVGREKYDATMDRRDLNISDWAQHLQEELADALQYAERVKAGAKLLENARRVMVLSAIHNGWTVQSLEWVRQYDEQFRGEKTESLPNG